MNSGPQVMSLTPLLWISSIALGCNDSPRLMPRSTVWSQDASTTAFWVGENESHLA